VNTCPEVVITSFHEEADQAVHGRTLNPFNRNLTAGGSTGGEGALVGFRGSPIGLAADGGGSIRSPAANQGLFGLKATSGRIPPAGCCFTMPGCNTFPVVIGPVCRSARDNDHFMKVIIDAEPWKTEQDMVPIPWRSTPLPEKIRIGFFADDGIVKPHPPVTYTVNLVREKLAALPNIEIVEWAPWKHDEGYDIIRQLYFEDGGADNYRVMAESGEPVLPLSEWVMLDTHTKRRTIEESWALNVKRDGFRSRYCSLGDCATLIKIRCICSTLGSAPKCSRLSDMSCWSICSSAT
jgi:amidase